MYLYIQEFFKTYINQVYEHDNYINSKVVYTKFEFIRLENSEFIIELYEFWMWLLQIQMKHLWRVIFV